MSRPEIPVLIVGAGPVGLALAIDLGWRGIPTMLVDKDPADARHAHPRMDNVGIRTMEFCRRWGIAREIDAAGFPRDLPISIVYATGVLGHELARDDYPDRASAPSPSFSPERHELCPQNFFDPVLQRAAARFSTNDIRHGQRLIALEQHDDHVAATLEGAAGARTTVRARYVAACDGAASTVARLLQPEQPDGAVLSCSTNIFFSAPELARRTAGRRAYRYILMGDHGVWGTIVNIDGRDMWRLQLLGDERWPNWTDAEVAALVRRGIGADVPFAVRSWMPWSRREYVADRFRFGRCFLVGDAAHQLSPTGGYGMNTGIAEAVDLSWKLAAVVSGWGGEALLDSYETERRPVALRNVAQASENLRAMRGVAPPPGALADDDARREVGRALQSAMQREWRSFGIHLGYGYRGSPLVVDDESAEKGEPDIAAFAQSARPGNRAPHVWLSQDRSTLDLFGRGFVLLDLGPTPSDLTAFNAAARATGVPFETHRIDDDAARAAYAKRLVLVRPDGHVAWRGDTPPSDISALFDRVRGAPVAKDPIMPVPHLDPAKLAALREATRALPRPWVSEIVLQTNQYDAMRLWYEAVLGGEWFVENTPDPNGQVTGHHGDGGKQVHAKDVRACFMRLPTVEPYGQVLALFELTWLTAKPTRDPGINHMQLKHADLAALIARIELLRDAGIDPHRSANHGPMTSFYFRDPDENIIELCIDNFRNPAEMTRIIQSPAFRANPSGIDFDRDAFIARFRSGEPEERLLELQD